MIRRILTAAVLCVFVMATPALGDGGDGEMCDYAESDRLLASARKKEASGKAIEAYNDAEAARRACYGGIDDWAFDEATKRRKDKVAVQVGKIESERARLAVLAGKHLEKKGRFLDASGYYDKAGRREDFERAATAGMKGLGLKDLELFRKYAGRVERPEYVKELKAAVSKNIGEALKREEKSFAARDYEASQDLIRDGIAWGEVWFFGKLHSDPRRKEAVDRAIARGDALGKNSTHLELRQAGEYYAIAFPGEDGHGADGNNERVKKLWAKAKRLGDESMKRGERGLAARYYEIAGLSGLAEEAEDEPDEAEMERMEREAAAKARKRQKGFKKEQDSLEKELGL